SDVVRLAGRRAFGNDPVLGRHGHRRHGLLALARVHLVGSEAEGAIRPDDQRALAPVDLQTIAAGIRGDGGHVDRYLGAARHAPDDVDAVRRIDRNRLAFHRAPLGDSSRPAPRDPCRPTMLFNERWRASPAISSASARLAPSGHSQKTGFPACRPAMTSSRCPGTRTQTTMRSTSGCAAMSLNRWNARSAPNAAAEALAVSSREVQTPLSS